MDNWTAPKYNFMKHTIVLGGSQFTCSIPLSNKREAKIKSQAGFLCSTSYVTKSCWQVWWHVNQPFILFTHHIWDTQYYEALFFLNTDLGLIFLFFALFKPILLQFFTILQDKSHSFNFQGDRSTRFLCTTNYRIDFIMKTFHEDCSVRKICS